MSMKDLEEILKVNGTENNNIEAKELCKIGQVELGITQDLIGLVEMEGLELAAVNIGVVEELEHAINGLKKMVQVKNKRIQELEQMCKDIIAKCKRELSEIKKSKRKHTKEQISFKSWEVFKRE